MGKPWENHWKMGIYNDLYGQPPGLMGKSTMTQWPLKKCRKL